MQNSRTTSIQVSQSPVSHFYQKVQPKEGKKTKNWKTCRTPNRKLSDLGFFFFSCEMSQKWEAGCSGNQKFKTWVTLYDVFFYYLTKIINKWLEENSILNHFKMHFCSTVHATHKTMCFRRPVKLILNNFKAPHFLRVC